MVNYELYTGSCGVRQTDMVQVIKTKFPFFGKEQMSFAFNPQRNALQLVPAAEELLVNAFGPGPGLSISPKLTHRYSHGNKKKPNRLYVRIDDALRSRVEAVYQKMCFASMQDLLEAAIASFVEKYEGSR